MKTAKIAVYGNIVMYTKYCAVYKIDYTLRCLEYICSGSSPLSRLMTFNLEDTDKCTLNYYKNNIANTKITR